MGGNYDSAGDLDPSSSFSNSSDQISVNTLGSAEHGAAEVKIPVARTTVKSLREKVDGSDSPSKEELESIKKEIAIQDNILMTLQRENEHLLIENKFLHQKLKEVEDKHANLEAKCSILQSSREFSPGRDDTVKSLRCTIEELRDALNRAESIKCSMEKQLRESAISGGRESVSPTVEDNLTEVRGQRATLTSSVEEVPHHQDDESVRSPPKATSQAFQYRLVEQLRSRVEEQESELNSLRKKYAELAMTRETIGTNLSGNGGVLCSSPSDIDATRKKQSVERHIDTEKDHRILELRVKQLEGALIEKDKCAQLAVEKLKTETSKIRAYYENAIKTIMKSAKEKEQLKSSFEEPKSHTTDLFALENSDLKGRIADLEEKLAKAFSFHEECSQQASKSENLAKELVLVKKERDELLVKVEDKNQELNLNQIKMKEEFLSQVESLREKHNAEINLIQHQHDSELRRLASSKVTKEFGERIKKKWIRLQNEKPDSFLAAVVERLTFLENYCAQKDAEMELNIEQILRVAEMENKIQRQKAEMTIEQKNLQIQDFQNQLDNLLRKVALLKDSRKGRK